MTTRYALLQLSATVLLGGSLALVPPGPAQAIPPPPGSLTAESLLARVIGSGTDLIYRGTMDLNGESTFTVTHGSGRRQRQEVLSPPALAGDVIIDNGAIRWHLSPQTAQADVTPSEQLPLNPAGRLALIKRNYKLALLGTASIAGEATRIIGLQPHSHTGIEHRLFVSGPGLPLRTERRRGGRLIEFSTYTGISWHPDLPARIFEPALPPGAKIHPAIQVLASGRNAEQFVTRLPFRPNLPRVLPSGYKVVAVRVYTPRAKADPTVHWQMSDGMSSLSLFCREATPWAIPAEGRPVTLAGGIQAARIDRGITTMLLWQAGGVRYSLVGMVGEAELVATARATVTRQPN